MAKKKKTSNLWKNSLRFIGGILLLLIPVLLFISLAGYDVNDPSFNTANNKDVHNYLGIFGAFIANLICISFGVSLPIFSIAFLFWGYDILHKKTLWEAKYRTFSFIFGIITLSCIFGLINYKSPSGINLAGSFGKFLADKITTIIHSFTSYTYSKEICIMFLLMLTLLFFNFACGITYKNWIKIFQKFYLFIKNICIFFIRMFMYITNRESYTTSPSLYTKTPKKKEPVFEKVSVSEKNEKIKEEKKVISSKTDKKSTLQDLYKFPSLDLLSKPKKSNIPEYSEKELSEIAFKLENVLKEFGINGSIVKVRPGPVVTLFELEPAPGIKNSRIIGLADEIARSMAAISVRIAVVPGESTIGIELPNKKRENVLLRELLEDNEFCNSNNCLNVVLGKDIGGKNMYADLSKMPHLLVAGTTGSGKSVGVNSMILSLLYKMKPEECRFIMIDPKMLEFSMYNGIPHLLTPVVTDPKKAVVALKWAVHEMEERHRAMAEMNVRNITGYNQKIKELKESGKPAVKRIQIGFDSETGMPLYEEQPMDLTPLPYIVIVVDEMADLMLVAGKEVEAAIQRLAQMARAAGIHLIMATQRPSVDVITGTIKANFPTRISFQVASKFDSRTILGEQGAEKLLGKGDMLYMPAGIKPIRVHGSFVADNEVESVVNFLKRQREPEYIEEVTKGDINSKDTSSLFPEDSFDGKDDNLYNQAVQIAQKDKKVSISYIQRRLKIGYNKAATIVEKMEENGVVTAPDHSGKREVLL